MAELVLKLVTGWVLLCAALSVGITEGIMHITSDTVTKWKYAPLTSLGICLVLSFAIAILLKQVMLWQDMLARGFVSWGVSMIAYDSLKSVVKNLPFMLKIT